MPWMANGNTGSMAEAPPSTYSSWPVMKLAWSVHSRTTALPTSAGRPRRLMGVPAALVPVLNHLEHLGRQPAEDTVVTGARTDDVYRQTLAPHRSPVCARSLPQSGLVPLGNRSRGCEETPGIGAFSNDAVNQSTQLLKASNKTCESRTTYDLPQNVSFTANWRIRGLESKVKLRPKSPGSTTRPMESNEFATLISLIGLLRLECGELKKVASRPGRC